ncbi:MAG: hypothetical protein V1797_15440, partial [Pseudomonadota bacterium]
MIEPEHWKLSLVRRSRLAGVRRSSLCHRPAGLAAYELELMALMDRQYLKTLLSKTGEAANNDLMKTVSYLYFWQFLRSGRRFWAGVFCFTGSCLSK